MTTRRLDRVNGLLRQEISKVLSTEISDPRLSSLVSITHVECSPDLRNAKVYVSVLGKSNQKKEAMQALKSASGFVHRAIRKDISIKSVPFLHFRLDESIEQGAEMLELIKEATALENVAGEAEE